MDCGSGKDIQANKKVIAELPMLTAPKEKEELIVYLAAAKEAISVVLMTERNGKQMAIYFVSRALQGQKINYTPMEKLILALVSASKRLKRYFQAHTIVVITDQPIKQILSNPEVTGRLLKWSFELEEHDIHYRPRTSVKGKILADFIVERPEDDYPDTSMEDKEELLDPWILFTDESSCIDGSRAGLILTNPEGMEFTYALRFGFEATNNEAEYKALIDGLRIAEQMGTKHDQIPGESQNSSQHFQGILHQTSAYGENKKANALSKIASTSFAHLSKQVLVEELKEKPIDEKEVLAVVEEEKRTWMTPIPEYLVEEILPEEKKKARVVRRKARRYQETDKGMQRLPGSPPDAKKPATKLNPHHVPMVILQMRIDIAGPFPKGPGKVKFLIVAIDYFTKFGLPGEIISDNENQFRDNPFKDWSEKLYIHQCFASVKHPQANGLVERVNRSLGEGIKARLDERSKNWLEEISHVLWAHRTMIKSINEETPFSLTYGTEAVIPVEIRMPTLRTAEVEMIKNDEALGIKLDLLEEKREHVVIQEAKSKAKMEKYYNARVRNTSFRQGDFVYRNNEVSHAEEGGKIRTKWEGPYEVTKALGKGAYKLRDRNGNVLPRTWNVCNLKKCYVHEM
ncbi:reverse transcriptase domain-containing protein [Tanacetum coccineum]